MGPQNQLIGIIEIDADPTLDATLDDNFGETLQQIRGEHPTWNSEPLCSADSCCYWDEGEDMHANGVVVLTADLRQLHTDLENELAQFIDRLLSAG